MRKILLFVPLFLATGAFAQTGFIPRINDLSNRQSVVSKQVSKNEFRSRGDTIFYDDFARDRWGATCNENYEPVPENAPQGYNLVDNTGNGYHWRWSDVGPRGAYTSPYGEDCTVPMEGLYSLSADNGFLLFEADWYNTNEDCELADTIVYHDAYVEYQSIDFSNVEFVKLSFQFYSFFCNATLPDQICFEISADQGDTWYTFDIRHYIMAYPSSNPDSKIFDISDVVAGEPDVWFRITFREVGHYYYGIDDLLIYEADGYDLVINDVWEDYMRDPNPEYTNYYHRNFFGGLYQFPWYTAQQFVNYRAIIENNGVKARENVVYNVDVFRDNEFMVKHTSTPKNYEPGQADTVEVNFANTIEAESPGEYYMLFDTAWLTSMIGEYKIKHYLLADHPETTVENDTIVNVFEIGTSKLSYANPEQINDVVGPDEWFGYEGDGSGVGVQFTLPEPSFYDGFSGSNYFKLNFVDVYIPEQTTEAMELIEANEASLIVKMYKFDEEQELFEEFITSATYSLNASEVEQWVEIPFIQDGFSEYIYEGGDYRLMLDFYGHYTTDCMHTFKIGSETGRKLPIFYSCIMNFEEQWGWDPSAGTPALVLDLDYIGSRIGPRIGSVIYITNNENEPVTDATILVNESAYSASDDGYTYVPLHANYTYHYQVSADGYNVLNDSVVFYNADTIHITLNRVGIQEANKEFVKIYPNPCTSKFIIETKEKCTTTIVNAIGSIMGIFEVDKIRTIHVDYPEGVYYIHLKGEKYNASKSIIIN